MYEVEFFYLGSCYFLDIYFSFSRFVHMLYISYMQCKYPTSENTKIGSKQTHISGYTLQEANRPIREAKNRI